MGFLSKLFQSRASSAPEATAEPAADAPVPTTPETDRITPVMPPVIPPGARPSMSDDYGSDRATVVAPEATNAALEKMAPPPTPRMPPPRPPAGSQAPRPPTSQAPRMPPSQAPRMPPSQAPRPPPTPSAKPGPVSTRSQAPRPAPSSAPAPTTLRMPHVTQPMTAAPPLPPTIPDADDFDASFDALESQRDLPVQPGKLDMDLSGVQALFGQLAANHLRQLRDFIIELRWGPAPASWIAVCQPSIASLQGAATKLDFEILASGLRELAGTMDRVDLATTTTIEGDARDRILAAHVALEKALPDTFAIDSDRSQREGAIVHALLSQIEDVRKVTIDKLYGAGLTTLETLLLATVPDLMVTTGIEEVLAVRIVDRFRRYRAEMASAVVDVTRSHERARIRELADQLRRQNDDFDRAAGGWTRDAIQQKKDIVLARNGTMLEIDLQLARLGEIALVRELERLPFSRKLARLEEYLAAAEQRLG